MADKTKIEWTDATWSPITGCSVVSPGCTNCYAMRLAGTRMKNHWSRKGLTKDSKAGPVWNGQVRFNEQWLLQPLAWSRPRLIFVCAHADLFHEGVSEVWIDQIFAVMALAPQHRFQVLTKRSARMRKYFVASYRHDAIDEAMNAIAPPHWHKRELQDYSKDGLPLPNVWLGVSVEDQARADERIPDLLETPAAVRWISAEPLLGPLDLRNLRRYNSRGLPWIDALYGLVTRGDYLARSPSECCFNTRTQVSPPELPRLDWVVAGGESGPSARPMHPSWVRDLKYQCSAAGVAFNFKQHGEWVPLQSNDGEWPADASSCIRLSPDGTRSPDGWPMQRVGKKAAGRMLDGVTHDEFPEAT